MTNNKVLTGKRVLNRLGWIALLLALFFSSLVWVATAQKPETSDSSPSLPKIDPMLRLKIEPALLKQLVEGAGGRMPIIVEMKTVPDLGAAQAEPDPTRRRQAVITALRTMAQKSQASVLDVLAEREAIGGAANVRSFWIFNGLAADADLDTVMALAAHPEVRIVRRDREYRITDGLQVPPDALPHGQGVEWNIARIRADLVWQALRVDGTGVVVANIDTGVDWLHPALQTRYRGYDPHGLHVHTCNWFDATGGGATYPVDSQGHGTHTMGTIVGGGGIGVAPGATWVGVRAFNSQGISLESWLHTAMQWIVDPGPDCTPPDVVSNSWSSSQSGTAVFRPDVQALRAAGIFVPFAAGNDGPSIGSIDAPAAYPEAFAVGAVTSDDVIASFSSRGPSTWYGSTLIKPEVSAPGVDVRSALPGGAYGKNDGTSMATPHVAGLAALMLQADPSLSVSQLETIIKETAVPLGSSVPNNDYGWGRIDAYAAVAAVADAGIFSGVIIRAADGAPIVGATLTADPSTSGSSVTTITAVDGTYTMALAPGRYRLTASAFGYDSVSQIVEAVANTTSVANFALTASPTGTLTGRVTSGGQAVTPSATIVVGGTPLTTTTGATGVYTTYLPSGVYTLTVTSPGHRVAMASAVPISAGETTVRDFDLITAPTILLVDSGAWYYGSEIGYYRQSLDELRYLYDLWTVNDADRDVPTADDLLPYDIVFWSSPQDSPGYLNASHAITSFLESGSSLFLSGQDVAYYDDSYPFIFAPYFRDYLKASYVRDDTGITELTGVTGGPFEGLTFGIKGPGGANNQVFPDEISVTEPGAASSIVSYYGDGSGGQQVGLCLPYRAIYLSYGFEAINDPVVRTEVISRSIAWFSAPPSSAGVELVPLSGALVGDFGQTVTHTLRIRNMAEVGSPHVFSLTPTGSVWTTSLNPGSVTLSPCESAPLTLAVQVPATAAWAASDSVTITAQSATVPGLSAMAARETRAPAPVLLVDDDRWYDVESHYQDALDFNGIPYDEWQVPWNFRGGQPSSPSLDTLQMYPMVLWFSAYDWYQPLTQLEEWRLANYLEGGGRLYYNGQDYLFHSEGPNEFALNYLGVYSYTEDFTSTTVVGVAGSPVGSYLGPEEVSYPYKNFSDAITPTASATVAFVGQEGQPNSVTNAGPNLQGGAIPWRTSFFAFDPDGLSQATNRRLMQRVTGWLSWLGGSTLSVDKSSARDTDSLTYTVVLGNDGWQDMASAYFTATFTSALVPIPNSVTGGASWDADQSAFVWSGPLAQGQNRIFTYQANINNLLPMGHVVSHTVWMGYDSHAIKFDRIAATTVNLPVLSESTFSVTPDVGERGRLLTYTLQVRNTGVADALVTATNSLPASLALGPNIRRTGGSILEAGDHIIIWTVPVSVGDTAALTYTATVTDIPPRFVLRNDVTLDDGLGNTYPLEALAKIKGIPAFLPVIFKEE